MKTIDLRRAAAADIARVLTKPAFDEVVIGEKVYARIQKTFGEPLSPRQLVDRIVGDIRESGDAAVLEYTARIDGVALTAAGMEVTAAEKEKALTGLDDALLETLRQAAANVRACIDLVMADPRWRLSLQDHKKLGLR